MISKKAGSIIIALSTAVTLALCGCEPVASNASSTSASQSEQTSASQPEKTSASSSSSPAAAPDLPTALSELDGVKGVESIDVSSSKVFTEKYLITFEQPLDHNDPSKGTFPQRVVLGIVKDAAANVLETEGTLLPEENITSDYVSELCGAGKRNFVYVEHRFFGKSVPKGLTNDSVDEWKYLTTQNAANDYHHIYKELSKVLPSTWAATGRGRGGAVCASYAYYYPDDMAVSVPYVAPFSTGTEDPRFFQFVYTQIGNERYGDEKAKEYRDLVTSFQVELMKNKSMLMPRLWQYCMDMGFIYRPSMTSATLFDISVLEFAAAQWQWGQDVTEIDGVKVGFAALSEILAMPEGNDQEKQAKRDAEFALLSRLGTHADYASNDPAWAYNVGVVKEFGQYQYDFSYLREACSAAGIPDAISIKPEEEKGLFARVVLTDEQRAKLAYDGALCSGINQWVDDTAAKAAFIYGSSDPWYSMRIPSSNNDNIKRFACDTKSFSASIADFDEATANKINGYIDEALKLRADSTESKEPVASSAAQKSDSVASADSAANSDSATE